jgi:hypothetical protein
MFLYSPARCHGHLLESLVEFNLEELLDARTLNLGAIPTAQLWNRASTVFWQIMRGEMRMNHIQNSVHR